MCCSGRNFISFLENTHAHGVPNKMCLLTITLVSLYKAMVVLKRDNL